MVSVTSKLLSYSRRAKFQPVVLTTLDRYRNRGDTRFSLPAETQLAAEFGDWFQGRNRWLLFRLSFKGESPQLCRPALVLGPDRGSPDSQLILMDAVGSGEYLALTYYSGQAYLALRASTRGVSTDEPCLEVTLLDPYTAKALAASKVIRTAIGPKTGITKTTVDDLKNFAWVTKRDVKKMTGYVKDALMGIESQVIPESAPDDLTEYESWFHRRTSLSAAMLDRARQLSEAFPVRPKFSIVVPLYRSNELYLREMVESVRNQIYTNWELILVDDGSCSASLTELLELLNQTDARVRTVQRSENLGIAATTNQGIDESTGDFVVFVDHDDLIEKDALFWFADATNRYPEVELIYSDEDKVNEFGRLSAPHFKPDWNPLMFLGYNYINHLTCIKSNLLSELRLRSEYDGAQDYDLLLRLTDRIASNRIVHVPRVLYHWRAAQGSTALSEGEKDHAYVSGFRAVQSFLAQKFPDATATLTDHRIAVSFAPTEPPPSVAIVIPTRDGFDLLRESVETCLKITDYPNYKIYIIDNQSSDKATLDYLGELSASKGVRVFSYDAPFNYSAMHNSVIPSLTEDLVVLLNNDTSVVEPQWLTEMVSLIGRFDTKIVGAKLLYGDGTMQHAGVMAGMGGGAGHYGLNLDQDDPGYQRRFSLVQNITAVTGACLLIDRAVYLEVGGMNEEELPVAFNDIDLCFKVIAAGYRVAWTPNSVLIHHESKTRGYDGDDPWKIARIQGEVSYLKLNWPQFVLDDPNYNPNLDIHGNNFNPAEHPKVPTLADFVSAHFKDDGKGLKDSLDKLAFSRTEQLRYRYGLRIARDPLEARRKNEPVV